MGRKSSNGKNITEEKMKAGIQRAEDHPIIGRLEGWIEISDRTKMGRESAATVDSRGNICLNRNKYLEPEEWAYVIAHCKLHLAFGHFDAENMPGRYRRLPDESEEWEVSCDKRVWNLACDLYVSKFLCDMKFGRPSNISIDLYDGSFSSEQVIYAHLLERGMSGEEQIYGTAALHSMDMIGLEKPLRYGKGYPDEENWYVSCFASALAYSAREAVCVAGGHDFSAHKKKSPAEEAKEWFINHYPLLGSLAAAFQVVEDERFCMREEISIAAISVDIGEIYINPAAKLDAEELRFVMAHELLHAGLQHRERCQGRNPYLWNCATDYTINGWLHEMEIGKMPKNGLLYDERFAGWSSEQIYDEIIKEMKKNLKLATFRGRGLGDIMEGRPGISVPVGDGMTLDEFCKRALAQGLEYHSSNGRGWIPAGLVEEIRALAVPPIPWDVELARWFDCLFSPVERHRTYARPSRRQGATPDIPRPRCCRPDVDTDSRTFGVVVDTSGSMTTELIGKALGSIASYAAAKEVQLARVVFCDAAAYDAGYLAPEDIAGRVEVKGRGGTRLQPGVDTLEKAKDFPKDGPILIITDGEIESDLSVHHTHAFLLPQGKRLPFKARGRVFAMPRD